MNARAEWLEARRSGIGGSDVAAILGLSKWKTPLQVWQEKRGELVAAPENEAMRWGNYLEPVVRQAYADATGVEVRLPQELIRHPKHPFLIANIDGFTEEPRVFEAKTARTAEGWGEVGSDQVPQAYLLQVQHYMRVTAIPVADVAVLIGGSDFRIYQVRADDELQDMLVDACREFWRSVESGEPPEPVTVADAVARWGRESRADLVMADDLAVRAVSQLKDVRERMALLEAEEEEAKTIVLRSLGECDTLVDSTGRTLATWKAQKGAQRFDSTAFKAKHPDLHAAFLKAGEPTRRFLLK